MDPDSEPDTQRALSLQWKSYKLVQDPAIRRVNNKIYRYDGVHFSVPDSGFPPVGDLRDPRPRRIWSRHTEMAMPVPKFKLDEFYVGPIPLKEVTFARLNDNIKEPFLAEMCAKFGEVEEMEILFHPKTRKHLGLARVLFTSTRGAKDTVKHLHNTSVMGNIIHAQLDIKGQQRQKYYDLIVSGSYTPQTVPTGGKALTERFQPPAPTQPDTSSDIRRRLSSEIAGLAAGVPALTPGSTTPCSVDTGFSEQRLDTTPSSMGGPYTPGSSASSQGGGTPYTPRSVSQDSGYAVARQVGYSAGPLTNSYPPQDMLPSSSCSSSTVSSSVGVYKAPRYSEDPHAPPQDPYQRCRPTYPPTGPFRPNEPLLYPAYPNAGGAGQHMAHHPAMPPPPPGPQYEQPPLADRDRERDRDSGGRYGAGGIGSRRSSYQEANSSSKYSHHSHHSERERGYRRDSLGSREHGRHRNHHSHNHSSSSSSSSSRRRSSHDRDSRERDRDSDYSNSSDPRFNSNSHRSSSNSLSPPPSAYPSYKDQPPPHNPSVSSRLETSSVYRAQPSGAGSGERGSVSDNKDPRSHHTPLPPPPPPPLPPASVIAAAVAETLSALDFGQESPVREETWTKPKRRPTTPPPPPQHPSTSPSSPPHSSIASSSTSPSSTSLPHHLPSSSTSLSPPPQRDSSSPEPDSTNESLPFVYHSSSLDSRIEMLLKEQKAKFSFLPSDEDEEEDRKEERQREKAAAAGEGGAGKGGAAGEGRSNKQREQDGEKDRRRKQGGGGGGQQRRKGERDRDGRRGRKQRTGGEGRKSPTVVAPATPSSTFPPRVPTTDDHASLHGTGPLQEETSQPEPIDPRTRQGAQTPPYNGKSQSSPHSSGEDMEISDEDEEHTITAVTTHHATPSSVSSPSSSQAPLPSQTDPSASPSDPIQHFGTSMPAPPIPSYTPHLPPPGFSLQPPPPPCIPPPLAHMELHPEYPPPMPPHMYDYASSMELMNQYSGGAPMSFQMQTQMLSRLHQLRMSSSNGTAAPGDAPPSEYYHSMPPPPHHPYMDQEGSGYGQDQHYMPPHMPYAYPGPSQMPHHHAIPPPHTGWAPHVLPEHYAYHTPPPYGTMPPVEGETQYGAEGDPQIPLLTENPHEATVQLVLATLIQEMKSIMQRDLNRKMVENIAFGTFDEWWERKETKAKPFQTMVRGVAAVRDEDKKEDNKASSKPREPLMSLVDWAKSGGMEGFSLRGALRLPSFKVKRKEPLELAEVGEMKRPKTPPEDDDEDLYHAKGLEGRMADGEGHRAERDSRRRKKKTRSRKPWDLDSEGEETSDGSSSDKEDEEEGSDKSEDEALSADSDDESLSSSTESSSSSTSSSSSSSEDEEEGEQAGSGLDTMDESTMDSTALDTEKEDDREKSAAAVPKAPLSAEIKAEIAASKKDSSTLSSNARLPAPRPSSPIVIVPPLKKRRKTVSFSTGDSNYKPHLPTVPLSQPPSTASPLFSHIKSHLPDSILIASTPGTTPSKTLSLLPFASKPGEGNALSPSPVLTVPSPVRPEDSKKSPVPLVSPPITPTKSPNKRGASPKSPAPVWVCRTVQNLPLDHASMVKMAFEEAPPPVTKGRGRGRPRTVSLSTSTHPPSFHTLREEEEEEEERLQRLGLSEQLGASSLLQLGSAPTADLSVLADVALKLDPDAGDSEETETSDEAEEQKMEEEMLLSPKALPLVMDPQGLSALQEHNYSKAPFHLIPAQKRSVSKQEPGVLLPADFNHHAISGVLEAPEEVIGEPLPSRDRHQAEYLSGMGLLCEDGDMAKASVLTPLTPSAKRKGMAARGSELEEMGKEKNKKRRRKDKEILELQQMKKQKEHQTKKQKRKLEEVDLEEDVDVEQLEPGELSNTEDEEEEEWDDVRKSERLFLQEAGLTSSQRWPKPIPAPEPATFDQRSEFEQMTILYDIWNSGLDMEDMTLLKTTYEKLLQDDHSTDWLNETHWVHHTVTNIPNPRRKKKSSDGQLREHVTGCARSEGYYAISRKEKDVYLDLELPEQALLEAADYDASGSNRLLSERRSEQRRLLSAIGIPAVMDSDLLKLNQLKFRKKKLRFGRSRIHEWGLFTMEPIAADEMVIEYVGQNIRQMVADNREKRYAQQGIGSSYLFRVDHDTIIDATKLGNLARFINHCCTPNCYAKVITIESQKKIVIYSKQAIGMNEEITYDYKFPLEENKIPCLCGTENCRGTLN